MTNKKQIAALRLTIKWFQKQIKPRDCGWMHTTIDGLKHRIKPLDKKRSGSNPLLFLSNRRIPNILVRQGWRRRKVPEHLDHACLQDDAPYIP